MANNPDLKWVEINDFRPGIISQAKFAYGAGDNTDPVPWLGNPGAAQPNGTVGCIALANGGLAPLPGVTKTVPSGFTPASGATGYINGAVIHGLGPLIGDEIVYGIETKQINLRQFQLTSYIDKAATTSTILSLGPAPDTSGDGISPLTGAMTRVNPWKAATTSADMPAGTAVTSIPVVALVSAIAAGDALEVGSGATVMAATASAAAGVGATSIPVLSVIPVFDLPSGTTVVDLTALTEPGNPCVALAYTFIADAGVLIFNWLYPDPGNPGSFSLYTFTPSYNSLCLTHQNRVVQLTGNNYPWVGTVGGFATLAQSNETFNYTDPPNSEVMGAQKEVFVAEDPTGIGAWGSIQSGELLLVKNGGGAFMISGDLNNPIVTFLGGVAPTYNLVSDAAQTVVGLVYASQGNGVWAWQGGTTAEKISNNLNDDFWVIPMNGPFIIPIGFSAASWGDWVCMTNGWLYDSANGGWWRLTNPGFTPLYYGPASDGSGVWAVAWSFLDPTDPVIALYDHSTPGSEFTWQSYPLTVKGDQTTVPKIIEVQEIVLRAQGVGTVQINLQGIAGSSTGTEPTVFTIDSATQPVRIRMGARSQAQDITVGMTSTGTGGYPAPTVYSVEVGYLSEMPLNRIAP